MPKSTQNRPFVLGSTRYWLEPYFMDSSGFEKEPYVSNF